MPSKWKPRDPYIFPIAFTETVLKALSDARPAFLSSHPSRYEARVAADRFREWRFCLRQINASLHRAWEIERDFHITLRTEFEAGSYSLWVAVVPRKLSAVERLNPHLAEVIRGVG